MTTPQRRKRRRRWQRRRRRLGERVRRSLRGRAQPQGRSPSLVELSGDLVDLSGRGEKVGERRRCKPEIAVLPRMGWRRRGRRQRAKSPCWREPETILLITPGGRTWWRERQRRKPETSVLDRVAPATATTRMEARETRGRFHWDCSLRRERFPC